MKPANPMLREKAIKLDHNVTTNLGNKQLVRKQNGSSLCYRLHCELSGKNNGPAQNTWLVLAAFSD